MPGSPPNNVTEPDTTTMSDVRDADNVVPIFRAQCYLDDTTPTFKGVAETLRVVLPPSSSYCFPHTAFSAVAHATEDPLVLLGHLATIGDVGYSPTSQFAVVDRTDMRTLFPDAPDSDTTAPDISAFSPAAGDIAYDQTISATATDNVGIASVAIYATYADRTEQLYEGTGSDFGGSATSRPLTALHTGGWVGPFTLTMVVTDTAGNRTSASAAYTISGTNPAAADTTAPTVELVSPLNGIVGKYTPMVIDIDDDRGIRLFLLYARYEVPGQATSYGELVYDGEAPDDETLYTVTGPTTVGGKQRYAIVRRAGWPGIPVKLRARLVDTSGNIDG